MTPSPSPARTRTVHVVLVGAALAGIAAAGVREGLRCAAAGDGPQTAGGRTERCLACHDRASEDPGGAHAAEAIGCSTCHLGDPLALDRDRAHAGLEREPGALDTVDRTCGRPACHPSQAARVATSLMATGRGMIAVDRWVFGELPGPDGTQTFLELLAAPRPTPAEDHLRRLCAGCHLHARAANRDDALAGSAAGCSACHAARRTGDDPRPHPPIDARVPDDRCRGCHARSGRISLTWEGLAEAKTPADGDTTLFDGRPGRRMPDDVHHARGLLCIDCHVHTDLMGDGVAYAHEEAQVAITCEACHGPVDRAAEIPWGAVVDPVPAVLMRLRGESRPPDEPVRVVRGVPVRGVRPAGAEAGEVSGGGGGGGSGLGLGGGGGGPLVQRGRIDGRLHPVKATPRDPDHDLPGHRRLSCQACHSAWTPTCTTCHTTFDPRRPGGQWDFGRGGVADGAWIETAEAYGTSEPPLGVRDDRIVPVLPGMVMTIDAAAAGAGMPRDVRLYAALDPHSTRRESRTCASCHASTWAVGAGRDATPGGPPAKDAWTGLFPPAPAPGTRTNLRSLDAAEQRRTLAVGPCLPCHPKAADPIYQDFQRSLADRALEGTRCTFRPLRP